MATIVDKLLVPPAIGLALVKVMSAAAGGVIFGTGVAPTLGEHVMLAAVRALLSTFSPRQLQWLFGNTTDNYNTWCTKSNVSPDVFKILSVAGGVNGLWIGNKSTAKYFMVYCHGGGFVMPGNVGHWNLCSRLVRWSDNKLAIMCVDYTLSPEAPYPIAIAQCVEGLRHVLTQPGASPSNTLLCGDSAGGNLVLAVLSHILHPHPIKDIVQPLTLTQPLLGALLISPWISNDVKKYASFQKYANRDGFPPSIATSWSDNYKGNKPIPDDIYMWAPMADASWWTDSPVKSMLATVGEHEVCFDSVQDWAQKYRQGINSSSTVLEVYVGRNETHNQALMRALPEEELSKAPGESVEGVVMLWVKKTLV